MKFWVVRYRIRAQRASANLFPMGSSLGTRLWGPGFGNETTEYSYIPLLSIIVMSVRCCAVWHRDQINGGTYKGMSIFYMHTSM